MRKFRFLIVTLPLLLVRCDDDCDPGPFFGELKVKLTINAENPEVHLVIFDGRIEKGDTLYSEFINESRAYYELEAGRYYSATARYHSGIREIVAVDGKRMQTTSDDDGCEYAQDLTLNLKLAD